MRIDGRLRMTAASMILDPRAVTEWLMRVMDTWEAQNVDFRQIDGPVPSLEACVSEREPSFNTKAVAAAIQLDLGLPHRGQKRGRHPQARHAQLGEEFDRSSRPPQTPRGARARRGARGRHSSRSGSLQARDAEAVEDDESGRPGEGEARCAWPDKPRLPEEQFRHFRDEVRAKCSDTCTHFLIGRCIRDDCTKSHVVPTAFAKIKAKFTSK